MLFAFKLWLFVRSDIVDHPIQNSLLLWLGCSNLTTHQLSPRRLQWLSTFTTSHFIRCHQDKSDHITPLLSSFQRLLIAHKVSQDFLNSKRPTEKKKKFKSRNLNQLSDFSFLFLISLRQLHLSLSLFFFSFIQFFIIGIVKDFPYKSEEGNTCLLDVLATQPRRVTPTPGQGCGQALRTFKDDSWWRGKDGAQEEGCQKHSRSREKLYKGQVVSLV